MKNNLHSLLKEIRNCNICSNSLPLGPNPIVQIGKKSKVIIIGQAPGIRVHKSGIPWNDPSGERLRKWLGISSDIFYNKDIISLIPMGFCYPGTGKTGDLPPRKECAPQWHSKLIESLNNVELILLVGKFSQDYYLKDKDSLTKRVENFQDYGIFIPLPHPSPRNLIWMKKNKWFENKVLPEIKLKVKQILENS